MNFLIEGDAQGGAVQQSVALAAGAWLVIDNPANSGTVLNKMIARGIG
jgi:ABC-type protease/lipase transport system fused ATPase/permease subunit